MHVHLRSKHSTSETSLGRKYQYPGDKLRGAAAKDQRSSDDSGEISNDVLPRHGSADLLILVGATEGTKDPCEDVGASAKPSILSDDGHPARHSGQSVGRQVDATISEPEFPVPPLHEAPRIPSPLTFNRRSTIADCSDITSPPNTAPNAPSTSGPRTRRLGTAHIPKLEKNATKREASSIARGKGRKREKELITPLEYAQKLQAQFSEPAAGRKKHSDKPFLKGKRIFYYGGDLNYAGPQTRNRMEIITRHGGILVPKYDPAEITHIVTDADERVFLRAIGLKKLADIPQHIPTVKWSWILSGFDRAPVQRRPDASGKGKAPDHARDQGGSEDDWEYPMDYEFEHAAYKARIDAGRTPWGEAARLKAEGAVRKDGNAGASKVHHSLGAGRRAGPAELSRSADDISNISDFTQDIDPPRDAATILPREGLPSPPSSPGDSRPSSAQVLKSAKTAQAAHVRRPPAQSVATGCRSNAAPGSSVDPLAEFYATARAERDTEMFLDADPDSESTRPEEVPQPVRREVMKKGFVCDDKGGKQQLAACPNQDVIDKLQELKSLHAVKPSKDDEWRVLGYNKAIAALRRHPTMIKSYEEAVALHGVGAKTAQKIMEIIETGDLRRIEHERTEDVAAIQTFLGIYGVGLSTATKWYNNGCRTLEDIKARKGGIRLTTEQEIGLKYYDDINTRIPRAEVEEIYNKVKAAALKIDPRLFIEIMGSYRRGKADCGDIDVLITRPTDDGKTHQGVLRRLLKELHQQGLITEDLCLPEDFQDLELVYRGLCRKDSNSLRRRIDFLTVPWISRGAALLYYTGDDIFNRSLRLKANKMGYALNQRGLYAGVVRNPSDKRQKLNDGHLIASESEREILDILGVPWQEPHERVRG
ncbi:hypothetical protein OH77DRAFT_1412881 [Trametes cingulata]|nr:hypothetical protein OH77DRAFT_1412881 [Trametes cingulata]